MAMPGISLDVFSPHIRRHGGVDEEWKSFVDRGFGEERDHPSHNVTTNAGVAIMLALTLCRKRIVCQPYR